jgi:IS66 Orf2 like protein
MLSFNSPIWFYPEPIDFRKQLDGLIMMVADHLKMNPTSGQLFDRSIKLKCCGGIEMVFGCFISA